MYTMYGFIQTLGSLLTESFKTSRSLTQEASLRLKKLKWWSSKSPLDTHFRKRLFSKEFCWRRWRTRKSELENC